MKLKTLKDIFKRQFECDEYDSGECVSILETELKAEAVKWVKEDYKECYSYSQELIIKNWMKRLDITEEDLK